MTDGNNSKSSHILVHKRGVLVVCVPVLVAIVSSVGGVVSDLIQASRGASADQIAVLASRVESLGYRADSFQDEIRDCHARVDILDRRYTILRGDFEAQKRGRAEGDGAGYHTGRGG